MIEEEEEAVLSTSAGKPKEDNRKLVYEDIWDDIPFTGTSAAAASTSKQAAAPTSTPKQKPANADKVEVEQKEIMRGSLAPGASAAKPGTGSWHEKYAERVAAVGGAGNAALESRKASAARDVAEEGKKSGAPMAFAPPPRTAARPKEEPLVLDTSELHEMD